MQIFGLAKEYTFTFSYHYHCTPLSLLLLRAEQHIAGRHSPPPLGPRHVRQHTKLPQLLMPPPLRDKYFQLGTLASLLPVKLLRSGVSFAILPPYIFAASLRGIFIDRRIDIYHYSLSQSPAHISRRICRCIFSPPLITWRMRTPPNRLTP